MNHNMKIALSIAKKAHTNQVDKGGNPYINHPLAVAAMVADDNEKIVALLHDVVEDSDITLSDLKSYGFCDEVIEAVKVITKTKTTDYQEYLKKIKQNPIARKVKIADLTHNMDTSRLKIIDEARIKKYEKAYAFLTQE